MILDIVFQTLIEHCPANHCVQHRKGQDVIRVYYGEDDDSDYASIYEVNGVVLVMNGSAPSVGIDINDPEFFEKLVAACFPPQS